MASSCSPFSIWNPGNHGTSHNGQPCVSSPFFQVCPTLNHAANSHHAHCSIVISRNKASRSSHYSGFIFLVQVQWTTDFGPTGVVHAVSLTECGQFHRLRLISPKVFICPK